MTEIYDIIYKIDNLIEGCKDPRNEIEKLKNILFDMSKQDILDKSHKNKKDSVYDMIYWLYRSNPLFRIDLEILMKIMVDKEIIIQYDPSLDNELLKYILEKNNYNKQIKYFMERIKKNKKFGENEIKHFFTIGDYTLKVKSKL